MTYPMTQARGPAWSRRARDVIVRLVGAGSERATDSRAAHRIRVNNGCALVCIVLNLVFTSFAIITGVWLMVAKQLLMLAVFTAAISLNHRGRFAASKLLLLVAVNLSVVGSFVALGMQHEVSMLYAVACLPLLMCELRERKLLIIGTVLPAVFALLMVASERFVPTTRLSPHAQHVLHLVLVLATFVALFAIMLFFVVTNARSEAHLRQAILDTRRLLDRVDQGIAWLDHRGVLGAERSAIFNQWLGTPAVNTPFADCLEHLDPSAGQAFALAWNGFLSGGTQLEQLSAQLPSRVTAAERNYSLRYKTTLNGAQLEGVMVVMTDVTFEFERAAFEAQRLELEADLFEARKLEAVGQLASGIAHELNTPAQFVGDNIQFVAESVASYAALVLRYRHALNGLTASPEHVALMQEIEAAEEAADLEYVSEQVPIACERARDGVQRISKIVDAMKEFAHPGHVDQRPGDLNRALQTALIIAQGEYKYIADVETEFAELPLVLCHINDITQVFLNLLVNAAHAIAAAAGDSGKRGTIRVTTRWVRNDTAVQIDVSDTGCGISNEVRHRVFDPFFTTKEVGKGTGQGLTIARSIVVDKHLGSLSFESEDGKGTTFSVVLPVAGLFRASLEVGLVQAARSV
jgi:signal transduction histidine kinase